MVLWAESRDGDGVCVLGAGSETNSFPGSERRAEAFHTAQHTQASLKPAAAVKEGTLLLTTKTSETLLRSQTAPGMGHDLCAQHSE